ncbi:MAG: response regulator transcription factor [Alphaproteobacteria bacterium]|nr:response regulator transcription factor [Alphaproteobacteria bacterium]
MDFDDKPVIYIFTTDENAFSNIANAARRVGYNVHFPEIFNSTDLLTINPEATSAVLVDLDMEGFDGVGLLNDIKSAYDKHDIEYAYRAPILSVSTDDSQREAAKKAGAEIFMSRDTGDQSLLTALLSLDESLEEASLGAAAELLRGRDFD